MPFPFFHEDYQGMRCQGGCDGSESLTRSSDLDRAWALFAGKYAIETIEFQLAGRDTHHQPNLVPPVACLTFSLTTLTPSLSRHALAPRTRRQRCHKATSRDRRQWGRRTASQSSFHRRCPQHLCFRTCIFVIMCEAGVGQALDWK